MAVFIQTTLACLKADHCTGCLYGDSSKSLSTALTHSDAVPWTLSKGLKGIWFDVLLVFLREPAGITFGYGDQTKINVGSKKCERNWCNKLTSSEHKNLC